jgi:hypothetical protein
MILTSLPIRGYLKNWMLVQSCGGTVFFQHNWMTHRVLIIKGVPFEIASWL